MTNLAEKRANEKWGSRKGAAQIYGIKLSGEYMSKALTGFRGEGSAEFFRQYTDELWDPDFNKLTAAEYGAFRRILAMFTRSKRSISHLQIETTVKELRSFGISLKLLTRICDKCDLIEFFVDN